MSSAFKGPSQALLSVEPWQSNSDKEPALSLSASACRTAQAASEPPRLDSGRGKIKAVETCTSIIQVESPLRLGDNKRCEPSESADGNTPAPDPSGPSQSRPAAGRLPGDRARTSGRPGARDPEQPSESSVTKLERSNLDTRSTLKVRKVRHGGRAGSGGPGRSGRVGWAGPGRVGRIGRDMSVSRVGWVGSGPDKASWAGPDSLEGACGDSDGLGGREREWERRRHGEGRWGEGGREEGKREVGGEEGAGVRTEAE